MIKLIGLLLAVILGALAMGYRVHPENVPYYLKMEEGGQKYEIVFNNGRTLEGVLESETADTIKINSDGAVLTLQKTELKSTKAVARRNFFETLAHNFKTHSSSHPLISKSEKASLKGAFDDFALQPSRIAEDMQKKNPGLSQTKALEEQMAANAKARLADYKARQAAGAQ